MIGAPERMPATLANTHSKLIPIFMAIKARIQAEMSGMDLLIYCGWRSPEQQARLWRASRSTNTINANIKNLKERGFTESARAIKKVGPVNGRLGEHVTWVVPGNSWHQYGCAIDAAVTFEGKIDWKMAFWEAWMLYGDLCRQSGLVWAGDWSKGKREYVHAQLPMKGADRGASPFKSLGAEEINAVMLKDRTDSRIITLD